MQLIFNQQHVLISPEIHRWTCFLGNCKTVFYSSNDSQLAAVATSKSVQIWQINTPQLQTTFDGHTGAVTCVSFSPNGEFVASGAEDKTVICLGLTLGLIVTTFKVLWWMCFEIVVAAIILYIYGF